MDCLFCHSDETLKNGTLKGGGQRYKCIDCKKHFTLGGLRGTYTEEFRKKIVEAYCHDRARVRELAQKFELSTSTIVSWAKAHRPG
ncbi:MAG TPA: hypothetical protein PKC14_04745, partial [Candidatus Absconditabacterales bacterium]|nr:hypothetical protein [Candidatus Absconditabacterales bacterium]